MSPSILQLQSIGIQDVYLTKDPQINIFKYNYYRYINFSTDIIKVPLNENATFNKKITCDIPKKGHLLSKLYLHIKLPQLTKNGGTYLSWSDAIGYSIFSEPIELEIGGVIVDKLYPQCLNIWDEFSNSTKQMGRNIMLNKGDVFSASKFNAIKPYDLVIPLDFWFTKQYNLALPLLSMYNQDVKIHFKFRDFPQVINYDGSSPAYSSILDSNLYAEYIFLDDIILDQFQRQKHMYIIEQMQYHGDETIPANTNIYNTTLKFNHPVKELLFACVEKGNVDTNNYFVYCNSTDDTSIISEAALLLDGKKRFDYLPEFYYRLAFPDSIHSTIPMKYVYSIPFSIKPEDNQPTGSLNMSRFNDVVLSLKLPSGNSECYLYVYGINYNIVTVENGNLVFEFAM